MSARVQGKSQAPRSRGSAAIFAANTLPTSIWLFDVRQSVNPWARLEGCDISFDAAPPKGTLPSNVSFRHWDVNQDFPEYLVRAFDIVHVRFFAFVLINE